MFRFQAYWKEHGWESYQYIAKHYQPKQRRILRLRGSLKLGVKTRVGTKNNTGWQDTACKKLHINHNRKGHVFETFNDIRVPQGYYSKFSNMVRKNEHKLIGLKSHD